MKLNCSDELNFTANKFNSDAEFFVFGEQLKQEMKLENVTCSSIKNVWQYILMATVKYTFKGHCQTPNPILQCDCCYNNVPPVINDRHSSE